MKSEQGVTLIEFMFSIAILAIVVLSSFFILSSAKQMSENSRYRLMALNTARSTLEQIKNTPLANVGAIVTSSFVPAALPSGAVTITTNPAILTSSTIATVTVTVSWRGPRNRQESLQLTTMRSRY